MVVLAGLNPRLHAALVRQFTRRDAAMARGATRVGWKLGAGDSERIGDGPVVGYLLSDTVLPDGGQYCAAPDEPLHVDVELAVVIGDDANSSVGAVAVALEIVALDEDDAVNIVAANIFHRAVVFGAACDPTALSDDAVGAVEVNGRAVTSAPLPGDLANRLRTAGSALHAMNARLLPGDRVITGSIVQVPVQPGDDVAATITGLPSARVRIGG